MSIFDLNEDRLMESVRYYVAAERRFMEWFLSPIKHSVLVVDPTEYFGWSEALFENHSEVPCVFDLSTDTAAEVAGQLTRMTLNGEYESRPVIFVNIDKIRADIPADDRATLENIILFALRRESDYAPAQGNPDGIAIPFDEMRIAAWCSHYPGFIDDVDRRIAPGLILDVETMGNKR